jgi:hypothetical protein
MQYFERGVFRAQVEGRAGQQKEEQKRGKNVRARIRPEAEVPLERAKKQTERGEDGMTSRARGRKAVRERKKAEEALVEQARVAAEEEEAATGGRPDISEE